MKCLGCGTEVYVNELHRDEEQLRELADGGGTEHTPERCRTTSGVNRLIEAAREALCGMPGGHDQAPCHVGLTTREKCCQCRRVDMLRSVLAEVAP